VSKVTFQSKRDSWLIILLLSALLFILVVPVFFGMQQDELTVVQLVPTIIVLGAVSTLLGWILLDTRYVIMDNNLFYYSGPFRGTIKIDTVRKIETDNSFLKGNTMKPSLSTKGFVIYYNKFDDIFISPKDQEGFVKQMLLINPDIELKR